MATTTIRIKKVCEWCSKEFEAQRCSTRFCSKACTDHAYKSQKRKELKKDTEIQSKVSSYTDKTEGLKQQEFLSVTDAAQLLNVTTRAVYNLIYRGTLKAYRLSQQWTVIRKEDLTAMIEARPYERKPRATTCIQAAGQEVTEFYTTQEIMEKFGVSNSWVFAQGKAHHIPKLFHRGKTLWSKTHCDRVFAAKQSTSARGMDFLHRGKSHLPTDARPNLQLCKVPRPPQEEGGEIHLYLTVGNRCHPPTSYAEMSR